MAYSRSVGTTIQKDGEAAWVGATITYDSDLNVTVSDIYCNSLSDSDWTWRITGSYNIDNDTKVYAGEGVGYKFTSPEDGKTFVFGASPAVNNVSTGAWTNTGGSFVVSSSFDEGDSGGDSGGEGGSGNYDPWGKTYNCILSIDQGEHTTVTVIHVQGDYRVGEVLENGATFPYVYGGENYYVQIIFEAEKGYTLSGCTVNGYHFKSGDLHYYGTSDAGYTSGNIGRIAVESRAVPTTYVYIDNETKMEKYIPFITNGKKWECYMPYIVHHDYLEGMFKAVVSNRNGANLMTNITETNHTTIKTIPYGTELIINGIEKHYNMVTFKTTYSSSTGEIYTGDTDYKIKGTINNASGAIVYEKDLSSGLVRDSKISAIPYGEHITISNNIGWNALMWFENIILADVLISDGTQTYNRYIKLQDVYIPQIRDVMEWVAYSND